MSHSLFITILDNEKTLIQCKNVELDLKDMQMFFRKVTMKAYNQLCLDLLQRITLQEWPELTSQEFAQWEDFSNKQGETTFLDLAPSDTVKLLSSALLVFILSKPELRQKFQDKKYYWSTVKISIYIRLV